ncbi:hypothetical protein [Nocardia gipuzkoensis]|uniref:hypothetical protein n=1 Tax=Nocardia gipuzkoensis TaxID=2749991 RepID=UPI002456B9E9|nr:hypothetical protein [Nocardia gipuzkoensis]
MTGWQLSALLLGAALLVVVLGMAVWLWPVRVPQGRSVDEITRRVRSERADSDPAARPMRSPHAAPDFATGVREAQTAMQRHRSCRVGECPRKTVAWRALVEAGRKPPDAGRQR